MGTSVKMRKYVCCLKRNGCSVWVWTTPWSPVYEMWISGNENLWWIILWQYSECIEKTTGLV